MGNSVEKIIRLLVKPYIDNKVETKTPTTSDVFVTNEYVEATGITMKRNCNVVDLTFDLTVLNDITASTDIGAIFGSNYQLNGTFTATNDSTVQMTVSGSTTTFSKNLATGVTERFHIFTIM